MALTQIGGEVITVSTVVIGITSTLLVDSDGNTLNVKEAIFQHESGGQIRGDAEKVPGAPAADGSEGRRFSATAEWKVTGFDDLVNFRMIKETGVDDAIVGVQLFGAP